MRPDLRVGGASEFVRAAALLLFAACVTMDSLANSEADDLPPALRQLVHARQSMPLARIEWTMTDHVRRPTHDKRYVNRYAENGDRVFESHGDQEGWVTWGLGGRPLSKVPKLALESESGLWRSDGASPVVEFWRGDLPDDPRIGNPRPRSEEFWDARSLGMAPSVAACLQEGTQTLQNLDPGTDAAGRPGVRWTETQRGSTVEVRGVFLDGTTIDWELDPARGWNPLRMTVQAPNGNVLETTCELARFGDHWFPQRIECTSDGKPLRSVFVHDAVIDQAAVPARLTPADIGVGPGFAVQAQNFEPDDPRDPLFWSGDSVIPLSEWREEVLAGRRAPSPAIQAYRERGHPFWTPEQRASHAQRHDHTREAGLREKPSLWERYTGRFILSNQLTDDQRQRALLVLRECQEQANAYLKAKENDLAAAEKRLDSARRSDDVQERRSAEERLSDLGHPLDEIFESRLKPGLDALLTRAQRARTDSQPAARP